MKIKFSAFWKNITRNYLSLFKFYRSGSTILAFCNRDSFKFNVLTVRSNADPDLLIYTEYSFWADIKGSPKYYLQYTTSLIKGIKVWVGRYLAVCEYEVAPVAVTKCVHSKP